MSFDLPPGLVGNAQQLPTCTMSKVESQLGESEGCPAATMVGVATIYFKVRPEEGAVEVDSPVYAIKPAPGEPAAFGLGCVAVPGATGHEHSPGRKRMEYASPPPA